MRLTPGISKTATICVVIFALFCAPLFAQTPTPRQDQDVVRVNTDLVQTDVMVFDKGGHFIEGLKKENFELRVDGQPKPIDFFERVTAGSASEESQLAAARGSSKTGDATSTAPVPLDRGRPIFFYLDDFHLDLPGLKAAKKVVSEFIDHQMGQNDEAAVTSATGQVGFLQQLTDNKTVLHAALDRINPRNFSVRDSDYPPMTEYQALQIENLDRELTNYFVAQIIQQNPGISPLSAEAQVHARANSMLRQADSISVASLAGLDSLVRSANKLPGRKLVFFISGGFFLNPQENAMDKLRRVTAVAAKNGVVIYTIDARGLVTGLPDASSNQPADFTGVLARAQMGELAASQDSLNALARDTGGKPVFNTNALEVGLKGALKDTSAYYLLAWKPESESQHASKFHKIEVKVIGRPELTVQVRRGFYDVDPEPLATKTAKPKTTEDAAKNAESDLRYKLATPYPIRDIPVSLDLSYLNTSDKGWMLNTMMEVPNSFLTFQEVNGKQMAAVNVVGVFYNDKGQAGGSFNNHINVEARENGPGNSGSVRYSYPLYLPPGLYHVRVAAQDEKSGRIGSAHGWVEVPNLQANHLGVSSVLIGIRPPETNNSTSATTETLTSSVELSASHRFARETNLRFVIFIYNPSLAPPPDAKPDLALTIQMLRDGQPVVTTPLKKVPTEQISDFSHMPYAGEIPLAGLPPGRYLMQITIIDRFSKQSASQQTRFEIE